MPVTRADIEKVIEIARAYGARRLILFGSAQHDPAAAHDLDLAVGGVEGGVIDHGRPCGPLGFWAFRLAAGGE